MSINSRSDLLLAISKATIERDECTSQLAYLADLIKYLETIPGGLNECTLFMLKTTREGLMVDVGRTTWIINDSNELLDLIPILQGRLSS